MPTGSIRVNFDEWKKQLHFGSAHMITFTQITEIESIRRQIENLQEALTNQAKATVFAIADDVGSTRKWVEQRTEFFAYLRETLCKVTVAKIVKLLDEAAKLGVDTDNEKKLLLEFLQELAPKHTDEDPPA